MNVGRANENQNQKFHRLGAGDIDIPGITVLEVEVDLFLCNVGI